MYFYIGLSLLLMLGIYMFTNYYKSKLSINKVDKMDTSTGVAAPVAMTSNTPVNNPVTITNEGPIATTSFSSTTKNSEWNCVNNIPVRINDNGKTECLSYDGKNCIKSNSLTECQNIFLNNSPQAATPLIISM